MRNFQVLTQTRQGSRELFKELFDYATGYRADCSEINRLFFLNANRKNKLYKLFEYIDGNKIGYGRIAIPASRDISYQVYHDKFCKFVQCVLQAVFNDHTDRIMDTRLDSLVEEVRLHTDYHYDFPVTHEYFTDSINITNVVKGKIGSMNMSTHFRRKLQEVLTLTDELEYVLDKINIGYSIIKQDIQRIDTSSIVLSINPVDFLLSGQMGVNTCYSVAVGDKLGSSKNALGEYSAGVLEYAVDDYTMVAYIETGYKTENVDMIPWKIWRQFIHVDIETGVGVFGKHYPAICDREYDIRYKVMMGIIKMVKSSDTYWSRLDTDSIIEQRFKHRPRSIGYIDEPNNYCALRVHPSGIDREGRKAICFENGVAGYLISCPVCGEQMTGTRIICSDCRGVSDDLLELGGM